MKKTLYMEKERTSNFEIPTYVKVTAEKVDEIDDSHNVYKDSEGHEYIVRHNNFKRRDEFAMIK